MRIRSYRPDDLAALVELFTSAVHELAVGHYDEVQRAAWAPRPPDLTHWRKRLAGLQVLVAELGGQTVGFLGYEVDGHIDMLFTAPGRERQGIASRLHDEAVRSLRAAGVTELFTEASDVARPFFEQRGYAVVARETVVVRGVELQRQRMRMRLF